MSESTLLLSLARVMTAGLAAIITLLAARAYRASRRRSLLALAAGAALLAAGYLVEGLLVEWAGWSIARATVLESVTTLVAVAALVASLYLREAKGPMSLVTGARSGGGAP